MTQVKILKLVLCLGLLVGCCVLISKRLGKPSGADGGGEREAASVEYLRTHFLDPPSSLPYNLSRPDRNPSSGQVQAIDEILQQKRGGFYVECGGLDGETRSNSLFLERERGWSGLLVEADPRNYALLVAKRRKAYASRSCLATQDSAGVAAFAQSFNLGHISGVEMKNGRKADGIAAVQCFPFHHYLGALGVTTVDYFSLDVEGAELKVLHTIPWDRVDIRTLSVEFAHDAEGKDAIRAFMAARGYLVHSEVGPPFANDYIFVRKDVVV